MSAAFREAYPAGRAPLLVVGGPRFDEHATEELGVDRIFGRGTTPGEVASYLVHALTDRHDRRSRPMTEQTTPTRSGRADGAAGMVGVSVTHRRYVPYSHAHYAGDLVDGAYVLGLFGDVATEMCIRTDGDEGLFASYSDVQFRAPVRAGDVVEVEATAHPGGHQEPHPRPRRAGGVPRRRDARGRRVGRRRARPAGRRDDRDRHRRRPAAHVEETAPGASMVRSGDCFWRVGQDTPKPLQVNENGPFGPPPVYLRRCASVQVRRWLTSATQAHEGKPRPPQDTRYGYLSATPPAGFGRGAAQCASAVRVPGPIAAVAEPRGAVGGETREGPDRPVDNGVRPGSRPGRRRSEGRCGP